MKELRINKLSMGLFALLALSAPAAFAEDVDVSAFEWIDVIETKDGSVLRGVVFEQEPGVKYKLTTNDGNIHVINAADVVKLTKARNKFYRGTAAAPQQHGGGYAANNAGGGGSGDAQLGAQYNRGGSGLPAPMAPTGVRATFALAAMFPSGDIEGVDTSFAPTIRIGYEKLFGNFGLSAGGQLRFTYWLLPGDSGDAMWTLETHGFVRGALHLGRVAPYLGGSLGIDTNYIYIDRYAASQTDLGVGLNLDLGLTIAATPQLSFDLGGDYHPGTDTLAGVGSVEYFALRAGAQLAW